MKIKRGIVLLAYCFVVVFVIFFFNITSTSASSNNSVLINEVYPNPATGEIEWIELYNLTDIEIELTDCSIEVGTHNPKYLTNYKIVSYSYLVLEKSTDFTFGLNNDDDTVILKCAGEVLDQVTYGNWDDGDKTNNTKTPSKGKSITRNENHSDTNNDISDFRISDPTPGENYIKKTYPYDVIINEILPAPENGTDFEFVEIFNNEETAIDLTNWQIDDIANGGSSPYVIPAGTIIEPKGYVILYHTVTKIFLNDDGDEVRLLDPNGETKDKIQYQKSPKGLSFARFSNDWSWTETITVGEANILQISMGGSAREEVALSSNIRDIRNLDNGQYVRIVGVVTTPPGVVSAQYFYIQDESGGIQVYNSKKIFPHIEAGNTISVYGKLSETAGEKRIIYYALSDIEIISSEKTTVEPKQISGDQFGEDNEGVYVKLQGQVTKSSGSTFYVDCQGTIVKVTVRKTAQINKPKLRKGDLVEVAGIVSQYKDDYRLLPIKAGDVKITKSAILPRAGTEILNLVITSVLINIFLFKIWNLYQQAKRKPLDWQKR